MKASGSQLPTWYLIARAEQGCDATEQACGTNRDFWEDPETIANEDLEAE